LTTRPRNEFLGRLGIYLLGIAIGLMIVGMIWQARRSAMIRAGVDPDSPTIRPLTAPAGETPGADGTRR
jgi:hypothetical protein